MQGREEAAAGNLSTVRMATKVAQKLTQLVIMDDISDARTPMPMTWKIWGAGAPTGAQISLSTALLGGINSLESATIQHSKAAAVHCIVNIGGLVCVPFSASAPTALPGANRPPTAPCTACQHMQSPGGYTLLSTSNMDRLAHTGSKNNHGRTATNAP